MPQKKRLQSIRSMNRVRGQEALKNLIDSFDNGRYYVKIYDYDTGRMIYSRGYDTYFGEYKTTSPALKGEQRTYHESVLIPYPKKKIWLSIEKRDRLNILSSQYRREIDPADVTIIKEKPNANILVYEAMINGEPHQKVDIVIVGEGYVAGEEPKFKRDLERYVEALISWEPYKSYRKSFNIYGVLKPSTESGCDEPRQGLFRNTALNASFNSLNLDRYLLIEDDKNSLRDIASVVPYDAIMMMANIKRYGGGAIYNQFSTFTSDGEWNEHVFIMNSVIHLAALPTNTMQRTLPIMIFILKGLNLERAEYYGVARSS